MNKKLFRRIFPAHLALLFFTLALSGVLSDRAIRYFFYQRTTRDLQAKTNLTVEIARDYFQTDNYPRLDSLAKKIGGESFARISFFASDGGALGDSEVDPAMMESHSDRPEVKEALSGKTGISVRFSTTLKQRLMYITQPVEYNGEIAGVVRAAYSLHDVNITMRRIDIALAVILSALFLFAIVITWLITSSVKNSLAEIKTNVRSFIEGTFIKRYASPRFREIAELAGTLDEAAVNISERVDGLSRRGKLMEDIFRNIPVGLLVIDDSNKIVRCSDSARRMLGFNGRNVEGMSVPEVVLDNNLQRFITDVFSSENSVEEEIPIKQGKSVFRAFGMILPGDETGGKNALIALNDITQLKKLENIRKDFVANVSHELKTPITAIKGFVEMLSTGGITNIEERNRFISIIAKHTDRINLIIDDLMLLAKMEAENGQTDLPVSSANAREFLNAAAERCRSKADAKNLRMIIECPDDLTFRINQPLLEQAMVNLLDNAVKFSPAGGEIIISAFKEDTKIVIQAADKGPGIEPEHQARLFERFYRVDKNRSRKEGGTGLGLSIVKHIALAHKGNVSVSSVPGEGSEFRIVLPK